MKIKETVLKSIVFTSQCSNGAEPIKVVPQENVLVLGRPRDLCTYPELGWNFPLAVKLTVSRKRRYHRTGLTAVSLLSHNTNNIIVKARRTKFQLQCQGNYSAILITDP